MWHPLLAHGARGPLKDLSRARNEAVCRWGAACLCTPREGARAGAQLEALFEDGLYEHIGVSVARRPGRWPSLAMSQGRVAMACGSPDLPGCITAGEPGRPLGTCVFFEHSLSGRNTGKRVVKIYSAQLSGKVRISKHRLPKPVAGVRFPSSAPTNSGYLLVPAVCSCRRELNPKDLCCGKSRRKLR